MHLAQKSGQLTVSTLYGGIAPLPGGTRGETPPGPQPEQQPTSEADILKTLYGEEPKPNEPSVGEEPADMLYGSAESARSTYEPALRDTLDKLADILDADAGQREQMAFDTAELFKDARIGPQDASRLHALFTKHIVAGGVDNATLRQWTRDSMTQLRDRFGESANARLEAAQAFVRGRPELAKILRETGLGSHPDVVRALTENTHLMRMQPRARRR